MDEKILEKGNELKNKIETTEKDLENLIERINDFKEDGTEIRIATKKISNEVVFIKGAALKLNKEECISVLETIKTLLKKRIQKYKQEFKKL